MKYDCNKTLDFLHEAKRMCSHTEYSCHDCELRCDHGCVFDNLPSKADGVTQESIDWLQKWSDENPEDTYRSMLAKQLPNCDVDAIVTAMCPKRFFKCTFICENSKCPIFHNRCWDKTYETESDEDEGDDQ